MSTTDETEADPSVCYRHPDRQSWVLCQRCGRTICPECQILAPVGVQCPDCVREAGGSVRWAPASGPRPAARESRRRPAWVRTLGGWLAPGGDAPVLSWGLAGLAVLLWIVGLFTLVPFDYLGAIGRPLELWRFVTGMVIYPPGFGFGSILSVALSMLFWLLNAPAAERTMGRRDFAVVVLAGGIVGNAAQMAFGSFGFGLYGALFAIFCAYLIEVWHHPPARTQLLIMLGINVLLSLFLGAGLLPEIICGGLAGAGAFWLVTKLGERRRVAARTPYLLVAAGILLVVVLVTARLLLAP